MSTLDVSMSLNPYQVEPGGRWRLWLFVGGRGIGKSYRGSSWAVKNALRYPGTYWGAAGRTWGETRKVSAEGPSGVRQFIIAHGLEGQLVGGSWSKAYRRSYPMELHFKNGSRIYFASADRPDSLRGENLHGDWRDEVAFWRQDAWDTRQYVVRLPLPDGSPARTLATSTPNGQNWLYDKYVQRAPMEGVVWIGGSALPPLTPPTSYDNPHLDDDFLEMLRVEYEGTQWGDQEIRGQFLAMRGAVFQGIDPARHTRSGICGIPDPDEGGEWDVFPSEPGFVWPTPGRSEHTIGGQDLGTVHPSVLLIGVWQGDRLCVVDEVATPAPTEDEWWSRIQPTLDRWRPRLVHSESASPMVTNAQRTRGLVVRDTTKSPTSVDESIRLIQKMLSDGTLVIDEKACPTFWRQIRDYRWKTDSEGNPVTPSQPVKANDDAVDALRYMVLGEQSGAGGIIFEEVAPSAGLLGFQF